MKGGFRIIINDFLTELGFSIITSPFIALRHFLEGVHKSRF